MITAISFTIKSPFPRIEKKMKALVINLETAAERLVFQNLQLSHLGIAFDRLPAVDKSADEVADLPYWDTWERPLGRAERACLLSHQQAWQVVAAQDKPVLILEDDAILSQTLPALLVRLEGAAGIDFITLETRGRKKLLSRVPANDLPLKRLYQDRTGAAAYILWPTGARKLLAASETSCGLADAIICACYSLKAFQAVPPLAFQSDRASAEQVKVPLQTNSSITHGAVVCKNRTWHQRLRRLTAQARMGLRQLQVWNRAERVLLSVRPEDFNHLNRLQAITPTTTRSSHGDDAP
ncbi:glycosyltransferase family 25 protein [Rhizobium sp. TH135]|uniref:glycosyltransferase family 25 protein n=1 Tax=Rhizobium sp. TH135 TaxID=2067451 RepID=UPI00117BFB90|nr:glycosyltransferase family 25 protein [Rhizobium sp. TH135]